MKIKSEITISLTDIKNWIQQNSCLHSLKSIRAKVNKRIKSLQCNEYNPLDNISIEKKKEVLKDLFV